MEAFIKLVTDIDTWKNVALVMICSYIIAKVVIFIVVGK